MTSTIVQHHDNYTKKFFDHVTSNALSSARVIVPLVLEYVCVDSVVDIGCGRGTWLKVFHEHGVSKVFGVDGPWVDPNELLVDRSSFLTADLRQPLPVQERFGLAVCLEVAEHLPQSSSEALVRQLTSLAPVVLFSAAVPGQGGTDHVNEQWPDYWHALFRQGGFSRLDCIRPRTWQDGRVAWFYQQNVYLFVQTALVEESEVLRDALDRSSAGGLTLVHPKIMKPLWSPRLSMRRLPRLIKNAIVRRLAKNLQTSDE